MPLKMTPKKNMNLSKKAGKYLQSWEDKRKTKKAYTPLVAELSGIIKLDLEYDFKSDYSRYLTNKYK